MKDTIEFLRGMAKYFKTTLAPEQESYVQRFEKGHTLIEADGGIGKTIAYLVCAMRDAQIKNLPIIIATSSVVNRDQIRTEHQKLIEYARHVGDPIADVPLFNFRSVGDYASPDRLEAVINRLEKVHAPKMVLNQLYEIRERLTVNSMLETVMPLDIEGEDGKTVVYRRELAAHFSDQPRPDSYVTSRDEVKNHEEQACIIVMTHAMLATNPVFRKRIRENKISYVIIDEVDKLTTSDFVTFTSLMLRDRKGNEDVDAVLSEIEAAGIDTEKAREAYDRLRTVVVDIKKIADPGVENIILIHNKIGENRVKDLYSGISDLSDHLNTLADKVDEIPATTFEDEIAYRTLIYDIEELAGSTSQLCRYMYPTGMDERLVNRTDLEVFLSWEEGDEFRVVASRPGALIEWLFHSQVPVLLTTAFIGEPDRWFAQKIGLPMARLNKESALRSLHYGELKFIYFTGLHDAVTEDPNNGIRRPDPDHFDDLERMLRFSPWAWEPGKCLLVLTPGYKDIEEIQKRLSGRSANVPIPIFPHLRGTNINDIRDKLIESSESGEGGILLTVYWEGFNIVQTQTGKNGRRGLIDVLLMSRIPFNRPNHMLESLHAHLGLGKHLVHRDVMIEAKRRIHQGFNRVIRGPMDKGVVLICDNRFPPPAVLTEIHDEISPRREYIKLLDAIPERFRLDEKCFDLVNSETWESL